MLTEKTRESSTSDYIYGLGAQARQASYAGLALTSAQKNDCLLRIADKLQASKQEILRENAKDLKTAKSKNLSDALLDRLEINDDRFQSMLQAVHTVMNLDDPVGAIEHLVPMPSGIRVGKLTAPIGVVAMIYESRPNVTIDAAILNIKAGNAVILRGGSEAFNTNIILYQILKESLIESDILVSMVQYIENTDRESVYHLLHMSDYVDLIIPRGGKELMAMVSQEARVNVLKHLDGNCHVYVDKTADLAMAEKIAWNAKTRRYGVCSAMESMLVHRHVAADFLPYIAKRFHDYGVELRLCSQSMEYANALNNVKAATEQDWSTEYLGPILSIKIVRSLDEAIEHINRYGSHHTDAIVANDYRRGQQFLSRIDSSSVIVNASTAFADGGEYGLGAEIGISTDKFHARGPVGIKGLTCQKYIVLGDGEIRP